MARRRRGPAGRSGPAGAARPAAGAPRGGRLDRPAGRGDRPRRDTVRAFDSVGQVHMDAWSRGRVALIRDAAHCPSSLSGMGSGLALVAACVLAGELAAAHGDHRVASGRYEQEMREYAEGCQDRPQGRREHHPPRLPRTRPVTAPGRHRHHTGPAGPHGARRGSGCAHTSALARSPRSSVPGYEARSHASAVSRGARMSNSYEMLIHWPVVHRLSCVPSGSGAAQRKRAASSRGTPRVPSKAATTWDAYQPPPANPAATSRG